MHKYLEKIEFDKITKILSKYAVTSFGKKMCLDLLPETNLHDAKEKLLETTESHILLYRKSTPPLSEVADITMHIKTLESFGTLSCSMLLDLANIFKICRNLKEYFSSDIDTSFSKIVSNYFSGLYSNLNLEEKVFSAIIDESTIDDHASNNLFHIRKEIQKTESDIRNKLNSYLKASYIQEPVVTIRAGRFVIPVKQEMRSEVKGFVHDISSSGSTVFVEPTAVFDLNNNLNKLKLDESLEIEKILQTLTSLFYPYIDELKQDIELIGKIDFAFAKAKYAKETLSTEPILTEKKEINLVRARHPLIDIDKVVPITLPLGQNYSCLIITGPNTGGKTVTLKTVGLLCAMAASGLYIPAAENSSCFVFDKIFADIGDEQSIAESLSTFSSHMTTIIEILNHATSNSLVLLDELGSGTDPAEGSSLAISILNAFYKKGVLTLSTTHYPEVKNFALVTDGFENASSEFDLESLKPTYKLLIGVPGQSNAFEISSKLGLSKSILEEAKSYVSSNKISVEEILKNIYDDKKIIENEKDKILNQSAEIQELRNSLKKQNEALKQSEKDYVAKAKEQARQILISAKEDADEIIKSLKSNSVSKSEANILRKNLKQKITNLSSENRENIGAPLSLEDVIIGNTVKVKPLKSQGTILSLPDKSRKNTVADSVLQKCILHYPN